MSRVLSLIVGAYIGVYAAQNFELPRAPGPNELMEKFQAWLKQFESKDR